MKHIIIPIVLFFMIANAFAGNDAYIISQQRYVKMVPLYQGWTSEGQETILEFSIPVFAYLPLGRNLSISLRGGQASVRGDYLQRLSGVTDTQLGLSYHLETANLVLNLGLNFPSGKKELTAEEFQTSTLLSFNHFNFQVPNFGQGLNVSPGLSWAYPLSDNFVLGLGASYQYKGKFKPLEDMLDDYNPGDEILFTGGFDLRLSETATFATDVIYTTFAADKIGSDKIFDSGNKIVVNFQFRNYFNYNELWLCGRYRSKAKNSLVLGGVLQEEVEKTTPDQIEVMGHYRIRFSRSFYASILAEGRFYQQTPTFTGISIYGFGIAPEISLSSDFKMPIRFKYLIGKFKSGSDISGLEIGLGLCLKF